MASEHSDDEEETLSAHGGSAAIHCHELILEAMSFRGHSTLEGYLFKLPMSSNAARGARRNWTRRFVVVHSNFLFLFHSNTSKRPSAALLLDDARTERCAEGKSPRPHSFKLTTRAQRAFLFAAEDDDERDAWLEALRKSSFANAKAQLTVAHSDLADFKRRTTQQAASQERELDRLERERVEEERATREMRAALQWTSLSLRVAMQRGDSAMSRLADALAERQRRKSSGVNSAVLATANRDPMATVVSVASSTGRVSHYGSVMSTTPERARDSTVESPLISSRWPPTVSPGRKSDDGDLWWTEPEHDASSKYKSNELQDPLIDNNGKGADESESKSNCCCCSIA